MLGLFRKHAHAHVIYTRAMLQRLFGRFALFCMIGAVSTSIDVAVLFVLVEHAHISVLPAATCALIAGSINGFILNKRFTFKDTSERYTHQYLAYLFVSAVGLLLTLGILYVGVHMLDLHYLIAKAIAVVLVTSWNFSVNYLLVFTHKTT